MNGRILRIERDKIVKNKYMIQVNELRIGNKVNVIAIDDWVTITSVDQIGLIEFTTNYDEMSEPVEDSVSAVEGIPLTPEILEKYGFEGTVWVRKPLGLGMVGDDGMFNLVLGQCGSIDKLPMAVLVEQSSNQGFSIIEAAEILKRDNRATEDSFHLKKKSSVCLYSIRYVHQLQNIYFALTGAELTIEK